MTDSMADRAADRETIAVYDARVRDYVRMTDSPQENPGLVSFMELLPASGTVLDLGCGPGSSAAVLKRNGFDVEAVDASAEMVRFTRQTHGIAARQATFENAFPAAAYDGIWANFSLLHAPRARLPHLIAKFAASLRDGGIFHIGMKTAGKDQPVEARDGLGRYYAYYSRGELMAMFAACGLFPVREFTGEGTGLSGEMASWIEIQARRTV